MNSSKKIVLIISIAVVIGIGVFIYLWISENIFSNEDVIGASNGINKQVTKQEYKEYTNTQFGFSLEIPDSWEMEELPVFIDGEMVYNGTNLLFSEDPADYRADSFAIVINTNDTSHQTAAEYVDYILEENRRQYEADAAPYILEYESRENISLGNADGVLLKEIKGPGGYRDTVYVVTEPYIYDISYSEVDDNGINVVTEEFRGNMLEVLNSFSII